MSRLIDADALYERACRLEAQALDYVGKLIKRDGDKFSVEWKIWSAVLTERTAFKHDVFDAPTVEPEQRWILVTERLPNKDGLYLVTTSKGQVQVHVFSHNGNSEEYWTRCNKAWMPLPKPYEEREDKE